MLFVSSSTRVSEGELKCNFPFPHVFCFILYKSERVVLKIEVPPLSSNFPFPHVFGLRRLRNAIRLVRFGYNSSTGRVVLRVAPISSFPLCTPFEGTHGDRVAGDNTDAIDFVAIASSLRATNG